MMKRLQYPLMTAVLWCAQAAALAAQEIGPPSPALTGGMESLWPSLGRLALTLVLVIGLIWGTMWLARKFMKGRWAGRQDAAVRIIDRVHLAPKKSIDIVAIGGRVLVLGVTDTTVGLLTELQPGDLPGLAAEPGLPKPLETSAGQRRDAWRQARQRMRDLFQSVRLSEAGTRP